MTVSERCPRGADGDLLCIQSRLILTVLSAVSSSAGQSQKILVKVICPRTACVSMSPFGWQEEETRHFFFFFFLYFKKKKKNVLYAVQLGERDRGAEGRKLEEQL